MKKTLEFLMLFVALFSVAKMNAQVTIGADVEPKPFSVLELYAQYATDAVGGLRLPQMTTLERNTITGLDDPAGNGLMIYNTTVKCVEYWNSVKWVSLCLGTANITLDGACNPATPYNADGTEVCTFTPADNPPCSEAYLVYLTAGATYSTLQVINEYTAEFSLSFTANNSSRPRTAIVRVVNNCSGEYKDFAFTQAGATCPTSATSFSLATTSTVLCGDNGSAIAYVSNPQSGMDYLWEYGGAIVNTGVYLQITYPGTYTVYAGLQGCETTAPQQVTITKNGGSSPSSPIITATNGGVLCSTGNVYLTASNVTSPNLVMWFHEGVLHSSGTANQITVSGSSAAGEWFAVQQNGTCTSRMSNIIRLLDQTTTPTVLPPPVAYVNGSPLTGTPTVCKNGTIELEVTNHSAYPSGTIYEWFINGSGIHIGIEPVIYAVSPSEETMTISVQAVNNTSGCPATAVSAPITISLTAPAPTTINNALSTAPICGSTPATLMAQNTTGVTYEWFKNGVKITTTNAQNPSVNTYRYYATEPGNYTVRYKDANDCWSQLSTSIAVTQSAAISSLNWLVEPTTPVVVGTQPTYTVVASPVPDSYTWTSSQPTVATVTPVPPANSSASVNYLTTGTTRITVEAANVCGSSTIFKDITSNTGCVTITSGNVSITPSTTVNKQLGTDGLPKTPADATQIFEASAVGATSYEWYVDGTLQAGQTTGTFTYTIPTGSASTHTIYAAARNSCTPTNTAKSATVSVVITKDAIPDVSGDYVFSGKVCFDIKRGNDGGDCMPLVSRTDDFNNGTVTTSSYTLSSTNGKYFEITGHRAVDPDGLLGSPATTQIGLDVIRINFNHAGNNIYNKAANTTKITAKKITVIVEYTNNLGVQLSQQIVVSVQDCSCGCTVKTGASTYLTFMCWNLGAASVVQTMTPDQQANWGTPADNYGDWYQWGRQADGHEKRTSARYPNNNSTSENGTVNLGATQQVPSGNAAYGKFIKGNTSPYDWRTPQNNNLWNTTGNDATPSKHPTSDPCPPGWRMPTTLEFQKMVYGTANTANYTNLAAVAPSGNKFTWNSSPTPGMKVSVDGVTRLFLPAAGGRHYSTGEPNGVGTHGYYWSSSVNGTNGHYLAVYSTSIYPGTSTYRAYGFSVRCVAEL